MGAAHKAARLVALAVSAKSPVTSPPALILEPWVNDALGESKTLKFPFRSRTKLRVLLPWLGDLDWRNVVEGTETHFQDTLRRP